MKGDRDIFLLSSTTINNLKVKSIQISIPLPVSSKDLENYGINLKNIYLVKDRDE
jgi:hypothetical protein